MLSETFFNDNDSDKLRSGYKKFKIISYLIPVIGIPFEILLAYAASLRFAVLFWPILLIGVIILLSAFYFVFLKRLKLLHQDLTEQIKLVDILEVISKSGKDKQFIVGFNSDDLKLISTSRSVFDKINIGDKLSVEYSKYAKSVLKLAREGEVFI